MKILVLSYEYPPIGGGGGVICKNISENLAQLGNQVTVLTTAFHETPDEGFEIPNLRIFRISAKRKKAFESNPSEMLSWIYTTKKFIHNNADYVDFDVCMAHFVLPGGAVAQWLKRKYGIPYVLISHGHDIPWVHPRQMFFYHLATYFWIKSVCKDSSINFIQTMMMKANIDRFMGDKHSYKNIIVSNGVDTSKFFPDYSKRPGILKIVFVGRLVLQKDPMTFLKAIRIFYQETQNFEVHILGDGNLRKKMEKFIVKNGLTEKVKLFGKITEEKMVEEYQSAHLMIASSLNEGMSISALEALSCDVYMITTRASGFEEIIKNDINGNYVNFGDPVELANMINRFFQTRFRKNCKPQLDSLTQFSNRYSWIKISRQYHEILCEN
jgi:glycosyltransferase involved in cell wall biosynthesis